VNMKTTAAAVLFAAALMATPATVHADCGDPGQDPCTGPAPTVDQVVGIMQQLTDPNIPSRIKSSLSPPDSAPTKPKQLIISDPERTFGCILPPPFVVTTSSPHPPTSLGPP
jgi:hypothetical protein